MTERVVGFHPGNEYQDRGKISEKALYPVIYPEIPGKIGLIMIYYAN